MLFRAVLFAVFWILMVIGALPMLDENPRLQRGLNSAAVLVMLGLLGYEAYHKVMDG